MQTAYPCTVQVHSLDGGDRIEIVLQQARCCFGAGIAQQMQNETEKALQMLGRVHSKCETLMQPSDDKESPAMQQDGTEAQSQTLPKATSKTSVTSGQQADKAVSNKQRVSNGARGLAVKALLARASIFKQTEQTTESNECMTEARRLEPAVGKVIKE